MCDSLNQAAPQPRHRFTLTTRHGAWQALAESALPLFALVLLLAIYGDALHFPFVFDDLDAIVNNQSLHGPALWTAWFPPDDTPVSGRPLVNLSFALNQRWAASAFGFRLVNLALHLLNAVLVQRVLRRLLCRPCVPERVRTRAAICANLSALLWACHPLQSEAVMYVTQRTELLAGTFALSAVLSALRYLGDPASARARSWLLLAAVSCALGSACKETLIAIPLLVAVLDRTFYETNWARQRGLYAALCVAVAPLVLQLLVQPRGRTAGFGVGVTTWQTLAMSGHATAWYLRLCAWPSPLSVTYNWSFQAGFARYWADDTWVAGLFAITLAGLWFRRWFGAVGGWFFLLLAPSTSFLPVISEVAAERRMYLPLLAVTSLVAIAVVSLGARARTFGVLACLLLTAALAVRTHARAQDYASAEVLFSAALRAAPDNPQAMWGLASALEERGEFAGAIALYERMAERPYPYSGPASWGTRGLLAASLLYQRRGDAQRAQQTLERALDHDPSSAVGSLQRAARWVSTGQDQRAIELLESMLKQPFLLDRVHHELGQLYLRRGDEARARLHLAAAAQLRQGP